MPAIRSILGFRSDVKAFNEYMNTALAKKAPGLIRLLASRAGSESSHLVIFSAPSFAALNEFLDAHSGAKEMEDFLSKVEGICVIGDTLVLTHDNDFNLADDASPAPNQGRRKPRIQINLQDEPNLPKLYTVPLP